MIDEMTSLVTSFRSDFAIGNITDASYAASGSYASRPQMEIMGAKATIDNRTTGGDPALGTLYFIEQTYSEEDSGDGYRHEKAIIDCSFLPKFPSGVSDIQTTLAEILTEFRRIKDVLQSNATSKVYKMKIMANENNPDNGISFQIQVEDNFQVVAT